MEGRSSAKVAPIMSKEHNDEEQQQLGNCLQEVLTNPLVCEKIASFLSLSDMKAASQVDPQFLQAIRGTRRFAQEAVLAITDKNAQKATLEKTEYSWGGLRIDVTDTSDILDDLPRVLKSAQFVCLGAPPGKIKNVRRVKDPTAARLLTTVLNSTPALSHLQIDIRFLCSDLRTVLSSPAVQETLRNLNRLEMMEYERQNHIKWFLKNQEADEEKESFERNFRLLTELPNRLKTFDLLKLFPALWITDSANVSVLQLLRNNTRTMEQLSLPERVWMLQELATLKFPVLKTLSANVFNAEEEKTLATFLENQRSLEELAVKVRLNALDESLVPSIRRCCMQLKKLDLTTEDYIGDVVEWSFLGSMNRLKEFRFKTRIQDIVELGDEEDGVTNGWRLLAFLPKNQLERLCLEGISTEYSGFSSVEGGVETEFLGKTELLEGFRCVRKLSFVGSRDAVDDQLMQWLLKEFVSLEELHLSKCSTLTDAGISGNTTCEWGRDASFADLHRLKTLEIVNCPEVTPNGVLASCVIVPCLKSLEYSNPSVLIVESVVLKLVGQNPRLERLTLDCLHYAGDLEAQKAKVKKNNPRVELSLAEEDEDFR